jgi:hypothetical protein
MEGMQVQQRTRDTWALTGALAVILVVVAFAAIGGNTPDGDATASQVSSYYTDNGSKEIAAAVVLGLASVSLLFFVAILKRHLDALAPLGSVLPTVALVAGVVAVGGFMTAATLHFALADYADDIDPVAAQAINAIDSDFFLPFVGGLGTLVLAGSLLALRTGAFLPRWAAFLGVLIFVIVFTPAGFIGFALAGIWLIVISIRLYLAGEPTAAAPGSA